MATLFGTDGIRSVANSGSMSPEALVALARAALAVLAPRPAASGEPPLVVIGRDTRLSGPMIEAALTAGLCSAGAQVMSLGVLPSPGIAYATRSFQATFGVVVSASHNPYADNGVKFFSAVGEKIPDTLELQIEERFAAPAQLDKQLTGKAVGTVRIRTDAGRRYLEFLRSTFPYPSLAPLRIGLDCAHGAASFLAATLFQELGAQVYVWHAEPDGHNINHACGSQHPDVLRHNVLAEHLDVGFALDGDADRLLAIDHLGQDIDGDHILAICAQMFAQTTSTFPPIVVSTVMANLGLARALRELGITLHTTQAGDKYVLQGMQQHGAWLGGEPSGHILFRQHTPTGDGLLTALQLLNAMLSQQKPLAELARVLQKFPQTLRNVKIRERCDLATLPTVRQAISEAERTLGERGRVLVRLSGTEPVVRVMVEGDDLALIQTLAAHLDQTITAVIGV